ncbi:hypothetical protein WKV44_04265 [Spirochaetia bacterium 38H-sp]|uniref:Band 7 domain-containing protein n=1 Tax=Rarispira pelagica TaxID=3141764 RepID=A0ABU9UAR6_9SPIR
MKKLVIVIILALIIGIVLFWVGNISFSLSDNQYAVVFSKTSGWIEKTIEPAKITWIWQNLIPFNCKIYKYKIVNRKSSIEISGTLPSGELYSSVLPSVYNFSYLAKLKIQYSLTPDKILLIAKEGIYPENIDEWYSDIEKKIEETISSSIYKSITNTTSSPSSFKEKIFSLIRENLPDITIKDIIIEELKLPDMDIYMQAKKIYLEILNEQSKIKLELSKEESLKSEKDKIIIERLQKYGRVLKENPELLEYFKLNPANPDPLGIFEGL